MIYKKKIQMIIVIVIINKCQLRKDHLNNTSINCCADLNTF